MTPVAQTGAGNVTTAVSTSTFSLAVALPANGTDITSQSGGSTASYHVNPHTVFRGKTGVLSPVYASTHPDAVPADT